VAIPFETLTVKGFTYIANVTRKVNMKSTSHTTRLLATAMSSSAVPKGSASVIAMDDGRLISVSVEE
jgi:hypothetical protein